MPPKSTASKNDPPIKPELDAPAEPLGGELERLRDILIGSHARTVSDRLNHLEARSTEITQLSSDITNLSAELKAEIKNTLKESDSHLQATRQEMLNIFTAEVAALRKELHEQAQRSQTEQQATNDRLQKLAAESDANLHATQTNLQNQIEDKARDIVGRMNQKDDGIIQELRQLAAQLEEKKVARDDLAQLLQDLAQHLGKSKV